MLHTPDANLFPKVSKEDLSSKLASDGKELRQRMADLSEHLVKEEQALSARIASWEEKAGVDRQEVSRQVADVTKGSSETETTVRDLSTLSPCKVCKLSIIARALEHCNRAVHL